jgi:hypothetical protein
MNSLDVVIPVVGIVVFLSVVYFAVRLLNKRVGLSLSACVSDIAAGRIKESEVAKIITSTDAKTQEAWNGILDSYCRSYWWENPEECKAIANRLYAAGKIDQPRTRGKRPNCIGHGHWIRVWQRRPQLRW